MKIVKTTSVYLFIYVISLSTIFAQQKVEQWSRFEVSLKSINSGNSFEQVNLTAKFQNSDTSIVVSGFYDGGNNFIVRFMPHKTGVWKFTTKSNLTNLNNKTGSFECIPPLSENHGLVKVSSIYNFKYADGKQYYPFGTTLYAWTHMGNALQEITLNSLKKSGFNKVRMCVFPKNYDLVKEEPELYPFVTKEVKKDTNGKEIKVWDYTQFNPAFFQHLEKRVDDLSKLGIEADLILFHPYDKGRWGFDEMPMDVNIKYIKYLLARLSSFRNVWWSLANEYDYVKAKTDADWELLSKTVYESDPYRHLCSIHGSTAKYYKYWETWYTHVSVQDEAPVADFGRAAILRNAYYKPIVYDEVCYEGNLSKRWGRYSGEEMLHAVWQGIIAGTYVTHGESYMYHDDKDTIVWSKGGMFKGTSWKRITFLRKIMEDGPGPLELADVSRDHKTATAGKDYYIIYFGKEIADSWLFNLPAKNAGYERLKKGTRFKIEIIDTWDMTVQTYPLTFETGAENDYRFNDKDLKKVRLPLKSYIALRITKIP